MITYPNQNIIKTHRFSVDRDKFTMLDRASQQEAMKDLKKVGSIKLWLYLTKNKDGFPLALSQKACEEWGVTINEYRSGKKELIDKGYLVPRDGSDYCDFYEYPNFQNPEFIKKRERENERRFDDVVACITF